MNNRPQLAGLLLLAFVAGVCIYQLAVYVGGFLAALAIPKEYFAWFGRPRVELALAVLNLATFALPIGLLFAGGALAAHRLMRQPPAKPFMLAVVAGAAACFTFWTATSVLFMPELPAGVQPYPPGVLLKQILLPDWWAVPGAIAPWAGLALAGWLTTRARPR